MRDKPVGCWLLFVVFVVAAAAAAAAVPRQIGYELILALPACLRICSTLYEYWYARGNARE